MALLNNKFSRVEYPGGNIYEGDFANGLRHGIGTYFQPETSQRYEGQWEEDAMHGEGIFFYELEKYVGQWKNNNREGHGFFYYEDGSKYEGQWFDDLRSGEGVMNYASGGTYTGQWKDDVREGEGTMEYDGDSIYVGQWVDDLRQGKGKCDFTGKDKKISHYEGGYFYDLPHGYGELRSAEDDSVYTGNFMRGYKEGQGKMETPTEIFDGYWHDNKRVQGKRELKGQSGVDWVQYKDNIMIRRERYNPEEHVIPTSSAE